MEIKRYFIYCSILVIAMNTANDMNAQNAPPFKTTRTEVHQAVQKGTEWTPGAIIDHIHFVRFDGKGRVVAENSLEPNGSAKSKILYFYNKDGQVIEEVVASIKEGGVSNIYQYHYDEQGRVNGKRRLDAERNISGTDTIIRNEARLVTKMVSDNSITARDGKKTNFRVTVDIVYNAQGQVEKVIEKNSLSKNGKDRERELSKNDTIPLKRFSEGQFKRFNTPKDKKIDFVYDEYNNWVKRIEYNGAMPEYIITRDIVYAGEDTDRAELLLKGKVKSIRQTSYIAVPKGVGTIDKGQKKGNFFSFKFDSEGRKTTTEHFSETGILQGSTEYIYNEEGNIQKEILKSAAGKAETTIQYLYGSEGNLKNKSLLNANGEIQRKGVFRHDSEGNCIHEIWFNQDGTKYSELRYQYDPYGQLIAKQVLLAPADAKNKEYEPFERVWNARGRMEEEWIGSPQNMKHYTYKYSTRGEIMSGTEPANDLSEVKYVYKFFNDGQGNWKKRIKFINDVPVTYEEREYTYYN